ncbi:redoxin domain-containing protein [Alkalilacustris brevis]|uniref:redoxin domain-containing protein n=1 Tax=Alkalilacustris brevis TaxID=2026338 RepID=UPI000E0CED27|nr:redoxin domain-containing protein [Alkalilacustris brevis]
MSIQFFGTLGRDGTRIRLPGNYRGSSRWTPHIGDVFPDFTAMTTHGPLDFRSFAQGQWVYLFSHPAAFTPVCTTEVAEVARCVNAFERRGVKVLSISRDTLEQLENWSNEISDDFGHDIGFPMAADPDGILIRACNMLHPGEHDSQPIRKSFIIDAERRVRMIFEYPVQVGRSVEESLRVIDALRESDRRNVAIPCEWRPGDPVLLPAEMRDAEANLRFGSGSWTRMRSYLRVLNR